MSEIDALKLKTSAMLVLPRSKAVNALEDAFFDLVDVNGSEYAIDYVLDMVESHLHALTRDEKN